MEGVAVTPEFWRGRSVLVTGHTGFKGAWLTTWLEMMGAGVTGVALPPHTEPSLWRLVERQLDVTQVLSDIRDRETMACAFERSKPEVVFHLAAQSLVRVGYREPLETFDINVRGTTNVLDAALKCDSVAAVVVVTSDKVYDATGSRQPYDESSALGGTDPYGASKACTEMAVRTYRESYFRPLGLPLSTVRAGNVIGGGDWATERLIPDVVRMLEAGQPVALRYPEATRPWQHVLDPLRGYLLLAEHLLQRPEEPPQALNFGPPLAACLQVSRLVDRLSARWGGAPGWVRVESPNPPEAPTLTLSSRRAREILGWEPLLDLDQALMWTASWYEEQRSGGDALRLTREQIRLFEELDR